MDTIVDKYQEDNHGEISLPQILNDSINSIKLNKSSKSESGLDFDKNKTPLIPCSFPCLICNKKFTKLKNLKKHVKLHSAEKPYKCSKCEMSYSRSDHLRRHETSHSDNAKPFHCEFCIQRFSTRDHLKRHINNIHNPEKGKFIYECGKCGESFNKKHKVSKHICKSHSEIENSKYKYVCHYPFCGKIYHTKGKLNLHIQKIHNTNGSIDNLGKNETLSVNASDKKYYQCPYENCYKTYTTTYNLKVHMKTFHNDVKEFICGICNQNFKHKCSLERHNKIFHSNSKPNLNSNESDSTYLFNKSKTELDIDITQEDINNLDFTELNLDVPLLVQMN